MSPSTVRTQAAPAEPEGFGEVLRLIQVGRTRAFQAANLALMETYWAVGQHLHQQVARAAWGKGVVKTLAQWLQQRDPDAKGFSSQNLWRMKQFYELFSADERLSALPRVLSWTHCCTLSRHLSPAMVAEYETRLIDKAVLQRKLHEWQLMLRGPDAAEEGEA